MKKIFHQPLAIAALLITLALLAGNARAAAMSDYWENFATDGLLRGGAVTTAGAAGSSAVVKGFWTATTAYAVGMSWFLTPA